MNSIHSKKIESELLTGETITLAVGADYDNAIGTVAVTDKRLLFKGSGFKTKNLSVGFSKISQVKTELGGFITNSYLIVEYSGGEAKFRIHGKKEAKAIADALTLATL